MQTVLSSKVLQRVVFAVIEKVLRAWLEVRDGFADCQRYREALQQVLEDVQRQARENQREDRRMHLLIEFVIAGQDALVVFYRPELAEREEGFDISTRELLFIERVSPSLCGAKPAGDRPGQLRP